MAQARTWPRCCDRSVPEQQAQRPGCSLGSVSATTNHKVLLGPLTAPARHLAHVVHGPHAAISRRDHTEAHGLGFPGLVPEEAWAFAHRRGEKNHVVEDEEREGILATDFADRTKAAWG